jgi:FAD/FMN-containing dehydrogenase
LWQVRDAPGEFPRGLVRDWKGTISAEHGIGLIKQRFLAYSRSAAEIELMRSLKRALDPRNILNPGKSFQKVRGTKYEVRSTE